MAVTIPNSVKSQLESMLPELDKRAKQNRLLGKYVDGAAPFPDAIVKARVTKAYRRLMPVADAPWASLIVDTALDRLEPSGIKSSDKFANKVCWGVWQDNAMDAESKLGLQSTLIDGRHFATVWRGPRSRGPEITLDDASTMIVRYAEGSRRKREAALRRWTDEDDRKHLTLYRPDGVFKFSEAKTQTREQGRVKAGGTWWEAREDDEDWPLRNPWGVVPVVEIAINRRLKPGVFPFARGEFENCLGLIDRVNLLTFLGLIVAFWMGFPLRGVIGEAIKRDDDAEIIPVMDAHASGQFQLENPNAKLEEFKAADRGNLSIFNELAQLSSVTKTPRHFFPTEGSSSNISADKIRAEEGALHAKVTGHKATTGEGLEEVARLGGMMSDEEVILSPRAELDWKDHESRSMGERADAAQKVASIEGIPWQFVAEQFLNCTQEQIEKLEAQAAGSVLSELLAVANERPPEPTPAT